MMFYLSLFTVEVESNQKWSLETDCEKLVDFKSQTSVCSHFRCILNVFQHMDPGVSRVIVSLTNLFILCLIPDNLLRYSWVRFD